MNVWAAVAAAVVAGAAATALTPFMKTQFETQTRIANAWVQVPIAVLLGGLAGLAPSLIEQITFTVLAVAAALLIVIDFGDYRLPDVIVLPLYPIVATMLTIAAWTQNRWDDLARAGIAAVAMFALYFVMAIFAPDLGFGDVKLSGVLGGFLGWFGISQVLAGFLLAWVMMALVGIVMIALRRIKAKGSLPFGPYMLLGATAGVFLGPLMFPTFA